jgi:hypothetical protein
MKKGKNEKMFAHVNEWKESGLSIRAYAKTIGFSKSKFEYWVRKVKAVNDVGAETNSVAFVEVPSLPKVQPRNFNEPKVVLTFPNGVSLTIYS